MKRQFRTAILTGGALVFALLGGACAHKTAQQTPETSRVSAQAAPESVPAPQTQVAEDPLAGANNDATPAARPSKVAALGASSSGRSR